MKAIISAKFLRALLALLAVFGTALAEARQPPAAMADGSRAAVDPWVSARTRDGEAEFLVLLKERADLTPARGLDGKAAKGRFVFAALRETAQRTQGPVRALLDTLGVSYRSYWVANMLWVRGGSTVVEALARHPAVAGVHANPRVALPLPETTPGESPADAAGIEWGVRQIGAPDAWDLGYLGQGVVVGGQDTGYQWDHPALKRQYLGFDGTTARHDYHWHDAIHSGGGRCGADAAAPCDDDDHGTHTMGTMVGDDGGANQIGVAPGARWIGCRNMDRGVGTPATYAECYQWFIAPTRVDGSDPDPDRAPHVINNSWGCPPSEGCTDPAVLAAVVDAVRAAGILTVHSAGNAGSGCSTIADPAAIYAASFTVAATDSSDRVASFSSRGPVTVDGSGRRKPDVAAPGVGVWSSVPGGSYGSKSGTSMAGPHVVGLAALLMSAQPGLMGDVDALEAALEAGALPLTSSQGCGGDGPDAVPNNVYGWGRIDALSTLTADPPDPDIRANDVDGPVTIAVGEPLAISIRLDPAGWDGRTALTWIEARRALGPLGLTAHYQLDGERWRLGAGVSDEGPLAVLPPTTILATYGLPAGSYTFSYRIGSAPDEILAEDLVEVRVTR